MADLGLIGGIADGFKEGLKAYQDQKQRNFNNRILLADMMSKGFQQDADGNITPGEGLIAKQQAGLLKDKRDVAEGTPGTPESMNLTNAYGDVARKGGITFDPNMSGAQARELQPLIETTFKSKEAAELAKSNRDNNPMVQARLRQNAMSQHEDATKAITNDSQGGAFKGSYQALNNAYVNFKNNPTPQNLSTMQTIFKQNEGGAGGNKSGVTERLDQQVHDTGLSWDALVQKVSSLPQDTRINNGPMVDAILRAGAGEVEQKQIQAAQRIGQQAKSRSGYYTGKTANPFIADYYPDFKNTVASEYAQIGLDPNGKPLAKPVGGDLGQYGKEGQGLINQAKGGMPPPPKIGDIVQGHRYKGGEPSDPNSWEK